MTDRTKSFDVSKLSDEEAKNLGEQLSNEVQLIFNKACEEANALLNVYGLQSNATFYVEEKSKESNQINGDQ